jgi:hypothetical protein
MKDIYRTALSAARTSFLQASLALEKAKSDVERLQGEMNQLRRTITALAAQCSEEPEIDPMGITEACVGVMKSTIYTLSTFEVVRRLADVGFDTASQKNARASAHAILTRLASKGEITKVSHDGKVCWRGPNYDEEKDAKEGPVFDGQEDAGERSL